MKNLLLIFLTFFELNICCDEPTYNKPINPEIRVPVKTSDTDIFYLFFIMKNSKNPNIFISRKNLKSEFEKIEKEIFTLVLTKYMNDFTDMLTKLGEHQVVRRLRPTQIKYYIKNWIDGHLIEIENNYRNAYLKFSMYEEPTKIFDQEKNPELENCINPRRVVPIHPVNI
jgi:hypothetical protein